MEEKNYTPTYNNSWALIIGINQYQKAPCLEYARNDAEAITELLVNRFGFPGSNITQLFDEAATRNAIISAYLRFAQVDINENDRLLLFFAGHGYTLKGFRNPIGYLVPVDGNVNDLSTLIRWDELTRNAEVIPAKHLFAIIDACFSGLAITRALPPGSARYLKDMLLRYSRQVLTAGKADETVADSGGPVPKHSIFTGHLIKALEGGAASEGNVVTANGVMAYVFDKVSKDQYSKQSPHYGFYDGDGDFIFQAPMLNALQSQEKYNEDLLVEVPKTGVDADGENANQVISLTKEYLSDERYRIKLDNLVNQEIRKMLENLSKEKFPNSTPTVTGEDIRNRLAKYEQVSENLQMATIAISHWGNASHIPILRKMVARLADHITIEGGTTVWLDMRWYPISLLMYVGAIASIAADNYDNMATLFLTEIVSENQYESRAALISTVKGMLELDRLDVFSKLHGGNTNYFAPRSEYMFKIVQPLLDDILFLGKSYDNLFDKAEIFIALAYSDLTDNEWGPPGRFGWKYHRPGRLNVLAEIIKEAEQKKESWPPLVAGLFGGSYDRFSKAAGRIQALIGRLNWF